MAGLSVGDLAETREARDIFARERVWRTRTTVLQSTGKVRPIRTLPCRHMGRIVMLTDLGKMGGILTYALHTPL